MRAMVRLGWLEIKLLVREPLTLVLSLALPLIVLFILGGVFGDTPAAPGTLEVYRGLGPMSYYVPAYLALVVVSVTVVSIPAHLAGYRERGVLKRYRAASVRAVTVAGAHLMVSLALASACSVVLLVGASVVYDYQGPRSVVAVVATFVFVAVGFTAFGLLLGAVLPTARSAQALGLLLWFVLMLLGGAGPPREVLGSGMETLSNLTPLWYAVEVLHHAWFGLDPGPAWWVFGAFSVVSGLLALRLFRWE